MGFMWVPAHSGIEGNETADETAKVSTSKEDIEVILQYKWQEMYSLIRGGISQIWQKHGIMMKRADSIIHYNHLYIGLLQPVGREE